MKLKHFRMDKGNSKYFLGMTVFASLIFVFNPAFAEFDNLNQSFAYDTVGKAITLNHILENPYDYPVSASIEFVFEDIDSGNHWDAKKHTGDADVNSAFDTHQSFFVENTGKFFIHVVYEIDGKTVKDTQTTEFVIFDEYSDAALNGCGMNHKLMVKPDYSEAVCVFEESVDKLHQRGWHGQTNVYKTVSEVTDRKYQMVAEKNMMTLGEFLRVDVKIDSPITAPHEIKVVGPDGKTHASIISESNDEHGWSFQARNNWPIGTYEIQLWHFGEKAISSTFNLQN